MGELVSKNTATSDGRYYWRIVVTQQYCYVTYWLVLKQYVILKTRLQHRLSISPIKGPFKNIKPLRCINKA